MKYTRKLLIDNIGNATRASFCPMQTNKKNVNKNGATWWILVLVSANSKRKKYRKRMVDDIPYKNILSLDILMKKLMLKFIIFVDVIISD
jgi:hypothetical protein